MPASAFYLEPSAFMKKYRREPGSELVNELFSAKSANEAFITSYLTVLEMNMVAARYLKGRLLRRSQYETLLKRMTADFSDYGIITMPIDNRLAEEAQDPLPSYALRAADALHLATARRVASLVTGQPFYVLSSDSELIDACGYYKLNVLNPHDPGALQQLRALR